MSEVTQADRESCPTCGRAENEICSDIFHVTLVQQLANAIANYQMSVGLPFEDAWEDADGIAETLMPIIDARAAIAAMRPDPQWQPIETAPYDTPVRVRVGNSMTFKAILCQDASENADGSCDQWRAIREGEHPPCWSEGACWESNENEACSMQPTQWQTISAMRPDPAMVLVPREQSADEDWSSINQWCDDTFGPATVPQIVKRAAEEFDELRLVTEDAASAAIEAADVVICLCRIPGFADALQAKMAINRKRKWRLVGDGTGYHIPLAAHEKGGE